MIALVPFDHHATIACYEPRPPSSSLRGTYEWRCAWDEYLEKKKLYDELVKAQWVVLSARGGEEIIWNGLSLRLQPGENIVPMPFWIVWRQTQIDVEKGWENLNSEVEAAVGRRLEKSASQSLRLIAYDNPKHPLNQSVLSSTLQQRQLEQSFEHDDKA